MVSVAVWSLMGFKHPVIVCVEKNCGKFKAALILLTNNFLNNVHYVQELIYVDKNFDEIFCQQNFKKRDKKFVIRRKLFVNKINTDVIDTVSIIWAILMF